MCFIIALLCLTRLIYIVIYVNHTWNFKENLQNGDLPNLTTGPLSIFYHRPAYMQNAKSKLSLIKNSHDMHIHNSLSNVAIHMPCINIHDAGRYQLEIVFTCAHLPLIAVGIANALHRSDCN